MPKVEYTAEQKRVINERGANILVSAAAGSGKTEVLTQRILSLITDKDNPMDIDRMLILTFTKAAAFEMKERISKEIDKRLETNPADENLWRQSALLLNAQITTIDSFCLYVVKNNFSDIGIDPGFRIMDEGEEKLMLEETVHELFDRHFEDEEDYAFRDLLDFYCAPGKEDTLENRLAEMYSFLMSNPDYDEWLDKALENYEIADTDKLVNTDLWKKSEKLRKSMTEEIYTLSLKAYELCLQDDGPAKYKPQMEVLLGTADLLRSADRYEKMYSILSGKEKPRLSSAKDEGTDPEKKEKAKRFRDKAYQLMEKLESTFFVCPDNVCKDSIFLKDYVGELLQLEKELICEYGEKKKKENVLSFSDMEHYALNILTKKGEDGVRCQTQSAVEYSNFYDYIMVDEYQDSNYVQEYILKSIARDNNYFMVGDIKQSIYGFRQASPQIFADKYNSFSDKGENIRIDLNRNFRSRDTVIDFVNFVFSNICEDSVSPVPYDDKAALYVGAAYPESKDNETEVILLEKKSDDDELGERFEAEAYLTGNRIKQLFEDGFKVTDKETKQLRDIRYSDIVILMRATRGMDTVFKKCLEEMGIPTYTDMKNGYFATFEVKAILHYLMVLDNPRQDIPLYGSLVEFFGGFSEEEIAIIKGKNREEALYDALMRFEGNPEIAEKIESFVNRVKLHREYSKYMGIRELLENIFNETGYVQFLRAYPDGEKRVANVMALLERAESFEKTSFYGLYQFVSYINELKEKSVDFGEAGTISEKSNVVRIMSVHGSKGLEFPVCFLVGTAKKFNRSDSKEKLVFSNDYGLGITYINTKTLEKRSTFQKNIISELMKNDSLAEEIRVLYVALTRAKEKLIITAETEKALELLEDYTNNPVRSNQEIMDAPNLLSLILIGLSKAEKTGKYCVVRDKTFIKEVEMKRNLERNLRNILLENIKNTDPETINMLKSRLESKYSHDELKGLYVKTTVSEIKRALYDEEENVHHVFASDIAATERYIPAFALKAEEEKKDIKAAGNVYGSAMHRIMEIMEFEKVNTADPSSIGTFIDECITAGLNSGKLSSEYSKIISKNNCALFFNSKIAERMIAAAGAGKLYKEKSFFYGVDANRVNKEFPASEMMLVQGVIDVYFEENDGIVVVDYKTDRVAAEEELITRYKVQLDIYAEALEKILQKKVKEKIIYSFALKKEISL